MVGAALGLDAIALVAGDQVGVEMRDALAGGFSAVHFDMVGIRLVAIVDDSTGFAQDKRQKTMFLGAQLPIIAPRLQVTVSGLEKVAIFSTKLYTKSMVQTYEKLSFEALNRHFL